MKEIKNIYEKIFKNVIKDKTIIISILLVLVLTYGFMLFNYSVGVDDLCLDRYVNGTYILSSGRWGTWLVYSILNITSFTPFWLDFLCLFVLFITSILLIVFIKKITNDKLNKFSYIMLGLSFISYPVVCNFLIYQPTNLTVCISNLIMIICVTILYEKIMLNNKKIKINFWFILLLSFIISMYESCCQTFVVLIFIIVFLHNKYNKDESFKNNIKFCLKSFLVLLIGIIFNLLLCEILYFVLDKFNLLTEEFANRDTILVWLKNGNSIKEILDYKIHFIFYNKNFFAIEFIVLSWVMLFLLVIESILNKDNIKYILWFLLAFLSNFILYLIMNVCTFRICYSWMIFIGFMFIYFIEYFNKYKKIIIFIVIYLVLMQSKSTNQLFYNDYKAYMRDVNYSNYIINRIIKESDNINKPLLIVRTRDNNFYDDLLLTSDNRYDFYTWGIDAFKDNGIEIVKFFNHLGYNFELVDDYDKYYKKYISLDNDVKKDDIIVLDDFIVVRV